MFSHTVPMSSLLSFENYKTEIHGYIQQHRLEQIDLEVFLAKIEFGMASKMDSEELVKFCSETAASLLTVHSDYAKLAAVILMSHHHATTFNTFSEKMQFMKTNSTMVNPEIYDIIMQNAATYDSMMVYSRDFDLSYFSINSLWLKSQIKS